MRCSMGEDDGNRLRMDVRRRVLFLEDELIIRNGGVDWLRKAGYDVVGTEGVSTTLKAVASASEPFDLLALNIKLDDGNGIDLCKRLRASGVTAPILMHSGYDDMETVLGAMRAGANDYMTKPYGETELVERVAFLLDLPPFERVRRTSSRSLTGSNLPTVVSYCEPRVESALARLEVIRPRPGTLKVHVRGEGEEEGKDLRPIPLDEKSAAELHEVLTEIKELLAASKPDLAACRTERGGCFAGGGAEPGCAAGVGGVRRLCVFRSWFAVLDGCRARLGTAAKELESLFWPSYAPARVNMRLMFHDMVTRLHSARTLSSPRIENCRNPSTDLMMPNTGSGVCLRRA